VEELVMVTPEVVGHSDPVSLVELKDDREARKWTPITPVERGALGLRPPPPGAEEACTTAWRVPSIKRHGTPLGCD
jgi:hypothetical protein